MPVKSKCITFGAEQDLIIINENDFTQRMQRRRGSQRIVSRRFRGLSQIPISILNL